MRRALSQIGLWGLLIAWPQAVYAADAYKKTQYYRGITARYTVTHVERGDVDGDGGDEVLVCYREPEDAIDQRGGVLILTGQGRDARVAWHALFEKVYPLRVQVNGKALTFQLVHKTSGGQKRLAKTLVRGEHFHFRGDPDSPLAGVAIEASSTLDAEGVEAANVFDRDLESAWAEGARGTGVDESIRLAFPKPVDLGLIGVLHGNFRGKRYWLDNNRLHRAEVTVETTADRYDTESDVDFGEDLGLDLYGDRIDCSFTNRPVMRYFKLDRKKVLSLELKITSVLLGEKNDDTYVAEIDLVELVPAWLLLGEPKPEKKAEAKPQREEPEESSDDWIDDF